MFEADERVRGVWLSGSLARGTADAASDLDLLVAVRDEDLEPFAAEWRVWLEAITPTVLAEALPFLPGSFWSVTPAFERFDVVVEPASVMPSTFFRTRLPVLDRDDLTARIPPAEDGDGPSAAKVAALVDEWFHFTGMPEVVLCRDDWLLAVEHLHLLRGLLYRLYVEANAPLPPSGLKQWSSKLTPEQQAVLMGLPTAAYDRDELVAAHLAVAGAFLGEARPLAERLGVEWPGPLEAAATAHLREVLGIAEPYP